MKNIQRIVAVAVVLGTALDGLSLGAQAGQAGRGGQAGAGQGRGGRGGDAGQARDASAQPVGTGTISGVVLNDSGRPVRRARVALSGAELRGGRSTVTSDEGAFEFAALPVGRFTLTASKAGFVSSAFGAKRAGRPGTPIQLAVGQKLEKATITLPRGSVVTGVVVDDTGEPAPGTQVRVMRFVLRSGERALEQAGTDTTDDRGVYRAYGLQPGDYMVSAVPRNQGTTGAIRETIATELESLLQQANAQGGGRGGAGGGRGADLIGALAGRGQPFAERAAQLQQQLAQADQEQNVTYAPVYFPGTASPSGAQTVTLGLGDERSGIDFRLMLVPTSSVSGSVVAASGALPAGTQVALVSTDRAGLPSIPGVGNYNTRVSNEGRFTFQNVTPGQYTLQARASVREVDPNAPAEAAGRGGRGATGGPGGGRGGQVTQVLWASADVTVGNGDVPEMLLTLQPGMTITGRVEFPIMPGAAPDPSRVRITLVSRGARTIEIGGTAPTQIDATGRFTITGVAPGRYSITAAAGAASAGRAGAGTADAGAARQALTLESVTVGGAEALDFPFEVGPNQNISGVVVRFGSQTQELSGVLQDAAGRPTPDYTVVLFPADARYWTPQSRRITASRPDTDGRFTMRNLPPGEYRLTAITDAEPGEWFDPAFLSQLQNVSIPVSIREGEKKVQDIRVAGGS